MKIGINKRQLKKKLKENKGMEFVIIFLLLNGFKFQITVKLTHMSMSLNPRHGLEDQCRNLSDSLHVRYAPLNGSWSNRNGLIYTLNLLSLGHKIYRPLNPL